MKIDHSRLLALLCGGLLGCAADPTIQPDPDPMPDPDPEPVPDQAGVWGTARVLHDLPGSSQLAVLRGDASGRAIALWQQNHPTQPYNRLWGSRRMGTEWEAPHLIANDSNLSSELVVVGDPTNARVAWRQSYQSETRIVVADVDAAGTWSSPLVLRSSTWQQGALLAPQLATGGSNTAIVWAYEDPATHRVTLESRIREGTAVWAPAPSVATGIKLASYSRPFYDVSFDDAGAVLVTWTEQQTDRVDIWARRGLPQEGSLNIAWESPQQISTLAGQPLREMWIGSHAGRSYAAWLAQETDGSYSLSVSHVRPDGTWAVEQTTTGIKSTHYAPPRFAAGADGHKVILWREALAESSRVVARTYDPDLGWSDTQIVADALKAPYLGCIDTDAYFFDVAIDPSGNALAIWAERLDELVQGRSRMGVWSSQFLAGSGWHTPLRVDAGNDATAPQIALAPGSLGAALFATRSATGGIVLATNQLAPADATQ